LQESQPSFLAETMPTLTIFDPTPPIVLLIGLQASGKSSFYKLHFSHTHTLISKDLLRNNKRKERRQQTLFREALDANQPVVLDNTFPSIAHRAPYLAIAKEYNLPVIGCYFAASLQSCVQRNAQRQGRARVPDVALYSTVKALQRPTHNEGFEQLYFVEMLPEWHAFFIQDWLEESEESSKKA
jgi:predicted kinase